jgi:Leucine-rich repeat (LRR) protein
MNQSTETAGKDQIQFSLHHTFKLINLKFAYHENILLQSFIIAIVFTLNTNAQSPTDLSNPTTVKRLDLTNNKIDITTIDFSKFVNLEYLSLKDDHLTVLPKELFLLKN